MAVERILEAGPCVTVFFQFGNPRQLLRGHFLLNITYVFIIVVLWVSGDWKKNKKTKTRPTQRLFKIRTFLITQENTFLATG